MTPQGLRLGVFAGSGPVHPDQLAAGIEHLERRGIAVIPSPNLTDRNGFLAGTDADRIQRLHDLANRTDIDGLIAARGGYGLSRIVRSLDTERFRRSQKPVIGFSDVTALHTELVSAGVPTIHGPVVTQLPKLSDDHLARLVDTIRGRPHAVVAEGPVLNPGTAEGPLWGGNLATFTALIGTPSLRLPDNGYLLLFEDVGETTYRIDRLLTQLHMSGVLERAAGIVLGEFTACSPAQDGHQSLTEVLTERLSSLKVPVLMGAPIGHGLRNQPVVLGRRYRLSTESLSLSPSPEA